MLIAVRSLKANRLLIIPAVLFWLASLGSFAGAQPASLKTVRIPKPDNLATFVRNEGAAIALGKALFYRQIERGSEAAYEDAARTMAGNMMEADTLEGVQAFIDKRKPDWQR